MQVCGLKIELQDVANKTASARKGESLQWLDSILVVPCHEIAIAAAGQPNLQWEHEVDPRWHIKCRQQCP